MSQILKLITGCIQGNTRFHATSTNSENWLNHFRKSEPNLCFFDSLNGIVSIKHGTILHGIDSARPIAHEPTMHENKRAPYRLDTPPIQHRLECAWICYGKMIRRRLDCARIGYAKTIQHQLDCARIGCAKTIWHWLDCAPLQLCTSEYKKNLLIKSHFFLTSQGIYNARKLDVYS